MSSATANGSLRGYLFNNANDSGIANVTNGAITRAAQGNNAYFVSYTFTADGITDYAIKFQQDTANATTFLLSDMKLEEGENATAWCPNANELKGANYEFTNESFKIGSNAVGDVVEHTPQYSKYKHSNGDYTQVSANSFKRLKSDGTSIGEYHYLMYIGTCTISGTTDGRIPHMYVDIPSDFVGKNYKVYGVPSYASSSGSHFGALLGTAEKYLDNPNKLDISAYLNMSPDSGIWTVIVTYFILA